MLFMTSKGPTWSREREKNRDALKFHGYIWIFQFNFAGMRRLALLSNSKIKSLLMNSWRKVGPLRNFAWHRIGISPAQLMMEGPLELL